METRAPETLTPDWMAGRGRLPWSWAVGQLKVERNYWLVTIRRGGFPQARPVWGVWSDDDDGLYLSVGHGGLQRATGPAVAMPITVHVDSAADVVIIEGVIDRIVAFAGDPSSEPTLDVPVEARRAALIAYNEKYSWNFDVDGDGLNFFVRPKRIYAWQSTPTEVVASSRFTIS